MAGGACETSVIEMTESGEFALSCLLTLLESFDKNNPERGIDRVARQMH